MCLWTNMSIPAEKREVKSKIKFKTHQNRSTFRRWPQPHDLFQVN